MHQCSRRGALWLALVVAAGCECGGRTNAPLRLDLPSAGLGSGPGFDRAGRGSTPPPRAGSGGSILPGAGSGATGGGAGGPAPPCTADAGVMPGCVCARGFRSGPRGCIDIDECLAGTAQCSQLARCSNELGSYRCGACPPGYDDVDGDGRTCANIDECALGNGGCGRLRACIDREGGASCGDCPADYVPVGVSDCAPTLIGLVVDPPATLEPAFSSRTTSYDIRVPLLSETVTLRPTGPALARIFIGGVLLTGTNPWTSSVLGFGVNYISIVVRRAGEPDGAYDLRLTRGTERYIKPHDTLLGAAFGQRVALSGDTLVVGAPNAAGGSVYVFLREGSSWRPQALLQASSPGEGDLFGSSVAIDGNVLVVGARGEDGAGRGVDPQVDEGAQDAGAAYVFLRLGENWTQEAYLKASNADASDGFGLSVAFQGETIAVGAAFEDSSARGVGGDQADNAASGSGAVYLFAPVNEMWTQVAYIKAANADAGDAFGGSVALYGDALVVSAPLEDGGSPGVNGDAADNSEDSSGAVYVFRRDGAAWAQEAYFKASHPDGADPPTAGYYGDQFGWADQFGGPGIAISGDSIAVGAPADDSGAAGVNADPADNGRADAGAVHVFTRSAGVWSLQAYLKASTPGSDTFGAGVGISGDMLVVGAPREDSIAAGFGGDESDNSALETGAAYVFVRELGNWRQLVYIKASNPEAGDGFGTSVAISGQDIAIGAPSEDSGASGVDADQTNNFAPGAGAVYTVF